MPRATNPSDPGRTGIHSSAGAAGVEPIDVIGHQSAEEQQPLRARQTGDLLGQDPEGLVPPDGFEHTRPTAARLPDSVTQAVWVIEHLQPGLAAGAQLAAVEGMKRIALDLASAPVEHPHEDAAPGGALPTSAGIPGLFSAERLLRRSGERPKQSPPLWGETRGASGACGDLEELTARKCLGHGRGPFGTAPQPPGAPPFPRAVR